MIDVEKVINPPVISIADEDVLCPPIGNVEEYMLWIVENRDALRKFCQVYDGDEC